MNGNNRYQQNHHQQNNRYQQQNRYQSSRKELLERDLRYLERDLAALDTQIDALGEKGRLLEAAKNAHLASVALSTLGVRYLPPVARTWHYKHQQYLQAEEQLKQYGVTLYTKRNTLVAQIEQIQIQIEMLQYQP